MLFCKVTAAVHTLCIMQMSSELKLFTFVSLSYPVLTECSMCMDWEGPLEEGMAAYTSVLAWKIPWTGAWWATVHRVA